jgi:hypothetical protein
VHYPGFYWVICWEAVAVVAVDLAAVAAVLAAAVLEVSEEEAGAVAVPAADGKYLSKKK